jgi:NADH-quinone oxidoreductase subunit G
VRAAAKKGLAVHVLHVAGDELLMPVASRTIAKPSALAAKLRDFDRAALQGKRSALVLGHYAQQHPDYAAILAAAQELGRSTGAVVGVLPDGANAVGAHLVGAMPGKGLDARAMMTAPRKSYLVAGVEAELDMGPAAAAALAKAEFVVSLSAFRNGTSENAHVILPIAPYTETGGTFVNMEGRVQSFNGVVKPQGEARPAWKVLRMLGALLDIPGFSAESLQDVRREIAPDLQAWATQGISKAGAAAAVSPATGGSGIERVAEFATYASDPIVRRSKPLQRTADGKAARAARMSAATAASARLAAGDRVRVTQGGGEARLTVAIDAAVPEGCVRIARGVPETAALGEGAVALEKVAVEAAA